jgi:hypothetical protein
MNYDPEAVAVAFQRLFRTYRFVEPDEADEMLAEYFDALTDYQTCDIEAGIRNMRTGSVDGFNPSFLPPAPLVAKAVRAAMHKRLDSEHRDRLSRPALPPPDIEKSPESRARVKDMISGLLKNLAMVEEAETTDSAMLRRAAERHDSYFTPTLQYTTGDPDAEHGDMGQREAS